MAMEMHTKKRTDNQTAAQVRKHYYANEYAIVAPRRSQRPRRVDAGRAFSQKRTLYHPIEDAPSLLEIPGPETGDWRVKVVANQYPAFTPDNTYACGAQEIVLETPRYDRPFHALPVTDIEQVLFAYQHRMSTLKQDYPYVSIFKNQGQLAGATLNHTHSQIIAMNMVPPEVEHDRNALTRYQRLHGTSVLCDIIRHELTENRRIVTPSRHTTTICPYASRFPLETWLIPHRQHHSIIDLSPIEIHSLADHLKGVAVALASRNIDFNYHLMESIPDAFNHFFVKVTPRIASGGGFELNTGMYINPVSPEFAARWYRQHIRAPRTV